MFPHTIKTARGAAARQGARTGQARRAGCWGWSRSRSARKSQFPAKGRAVPLKLIKTKRAPTKAARPRRVVHQARPIADRFPVGSALNRRRAFRPQHRTPWPFCHSTKVSHGRSLAAACSRARTNENESQSLFSINRPCRASLIHCRLYHHLYKVRGRAKSRRPGARARTSRRASQPTTQRRQAPFPVTRSCSPLLIPHTAPNAFSRSCRTINKVIGEYRLVLCLYPTIGYALYKLDSR